MKVKQTHKPNNIVIRPIKVEDAPAINAMRIMPGINESIYGLTSERIESAIKFIQSLSEHDHMFVAEIDDVVVGTGSLHTDKRPRLNHCGHIGIMVNTDHQGLGIGRKIMEKLLDLADNWLMLVRLELEVFDDNDNAIKLYKSLGFVVEGTKKYAAVRQAKFCDVLLMARYNIPT